MTLVLEIEHLLGLAFAARDQGSTTPGWPPQPDRVFSALVASWGARGEREDERRALEWLEGLPPPEIAASGGSPRTAPIVFVPPNDAEGGRVGNAAVLPGLRRRQARRFPAFRPEDPTVSLVWGIAAPDGAILAALNALAADTAYVGHSASLTRCRFHDREPSTATSASWRRVYPGRLAELEAGFRARPLRRPSPGAPVRTADAHPPAVQSGVFSDRWLVLEHVEGEMPDIRAAALVAKELRNSLMSGYREMGRETAVPAALSGHAPDGRPTSEPHLAIAPLGFLGWPHASGTVFGYGLVPPRDGDLFADPDFRRALRSVMRSGRGEDEPAETRPRLILDRWKLAFEIGNRSERRSLDPASYVGEARIWASCTPIVLDRHLKASGNAARQQEVEDLISRACLNTGLPEPMRVSAAKHSAIEGAPAAYPSGGAPRWTRWKLPERLASRQLTHAVIEFSSAVRGPVILGAGRFVGLGLCQSSGAGK